MLWVLFRASGVCSLLLASALFSWSAEKKPEELRVFASIGLTESLTEIASRYTQATQRKVRLNFAGSNLIAQQVLLGVPADLFISGDAKWMNELENKGLVRPETRRALVSSTLVIVINKDSPLVIKRPEDLLMPKVGRIALGDPNNVASGIYGREFMERHQLWQRLEPRLLITSNSRATLSAVEADRVGVGFVYITDAMISHGIKVAYEIPPSEIPPIHFYAAQTKGSKRPAEAQSFLDFLAQPEASTIFKRFGFTVLPQPNTLTPAAK